MADQYEIMRQELAKVLNENLYHNAASFCLYINDIFAIYVATGRLISSEDINSIEVNEKPRRSEAGGSFS